MIYADVNGSAPVCNAVKEYLLSRIESGPYANPNSIHSLGKKMMFGIEKCRRSIAKNLGCKSNQIIFNSGSSEGISHIFFSLLNCGPKDNKNIIITSGIEHSATVEACAHYEKNGFKIIKISSTVDGVIDLVEFEKVVKEHKSQTALVSIMAANNETGVIQPYQEIGKICQQNEVLFFSDTTQFIGKTKFNFGESNMDFAVLSSHKIGALIGSGLIIAKNPDLLKSHVFGGGQEFGLRGGTQNYIGIETMAVALDTFTKHIHLLDEINSLRLKFEQNILKNFPQAKVIGYKAPRLATTTLISYPGVHGQAVQIELESQDIFVTTSSACSDNEPDTSKVLKSMGISDEIGRGVVRISLCIGAKAEDYNQIEVALTNAYNKLNKLKSY